MKIKIIATLFISLCFLLSGCKSQTYQMPKKFRQNFKQIEGVSLQKLSKEKPKTPLQSVSEVEQPEQIAKRDMAMNVETIRTMVLTQNLDLQISYITPEIAASEVLIEKAKFDAVFTIDAQHRSTKLQSAKEKESLGEVSLILPLSSGGYLKTSLPYLKDDDYSHVSGPRISFEQPLLRNAGRQVNETSIAIARINEKKTTAATKLNVIRLLAIAEKAYWDFYAAEQILTVNYELHNLAKKQHELATLLVGQGVITKMDELIAESNLTRTLERIYNAELSRRLFQRRLKVLMNMDKKDLSPELHFLAQQQPSPLSLKLDSQELTSLALSNRLDMLKLEMELSIQALSIDYLDNQTLPLFSVNFDYQLSSQSENFDHHLTDFNATDQNEWIVGLKFEVPLSNTAAKERLRQAQLQKLIVANEKDLLSLQIYQEVHNVIDQINNIWQKLLLAKREVQLNNRVYLAEVESFKNGTGSSNDIQIAQDRLASSQIRYIIAVRDYEKAKINLAFSSGTVLGKSKIEWK